MLDSRAATGLLEAELLVIAAISIVLAWANPTGYPGRA